jgi:hypothetical protein
MSFGDLLPPPPTELTYASLAAFGWKLYLHNGAGAQHKNALRFGSNQAGVGNVATDPKMPNGRGFAKMAESVFDSSDFKTILAIDSTGSWVKGTKMDGSAFTASSEVFAVKSFTSVDLEFYTSRSANPTMISLSPHP